ncbi:hypothetical protein Lal_00033583 [Lupinus albus]|nr:hypothetical protein Lal_00033583 [Lupinus albus]
MSDHRFEKFVEEEWKKLEVSGRGSFVLKEKIKLLKGALKVWNKDHFGILDRRVADQVDIINSIDAQGNIRSITEDDILIRREATTELWRALNQKDNLRHQKSRHKWICEGDSNSRFFYSSLNRSRGFKVLSGLYINEEWVEDPIRVKDHIRFFFEKKFAENHWNMPNLDGIEFNRLSDVDNDFLTAKFEEEEIKEAI